MGLYNGQNVRHYLPIDTDEGAGPPCSYRSTSCLETGRAPLEIEIPDDTEERFRLRAAVEIAVQKEARLVGADLARADLARANLARANLARADLDGADLAGANLDGADLAGADLARAILVRASLIRADLDGADLARANLDGADLAGADLDGADLAGADLDGASLARANLARANLDGADLAGADLDGASLARASLAGTSFNGANLVRAILNNIRNDLWDVLLRAQSEVPALLAALREGRIDGSTYEGECACLAGTIANARGVSHRTLGFANPYRLIERWFLGISKGSTPSTNQIARITEGWIVEFQRLVGQEAS